MRILVTNDDGFDSPLLHLFVKELSLQSWVDSIDVAVPATEQSWVAGAVNRRGIRNVRTREHDGQVYHLIDGSPADCTSIGCTVLLEEKPDMVLSGINFGFNAGTCFYLGSGTVAGARQASLFNIPGVSCSATLPRDIFMLWNGRDFSSLNEKMDYLGHIAKTQVEIVGTLLSKNIFNPGKRPRTDFVSINTPEKIISSEPVFTVLEPTRFKPIFNKISDNEYRHQFQGFQERDDERFRQLDRKLPTDLETLGAGKNSVTLFSLDTQGEITEVEF
jgi:5'/3'-nucleotidase SurE